MHLVFCRAFRLRPRSRLSTKDVTGSRLSTALDSENTKRDHSKINQLLCFLSHNVSNSNLWICSHCSCC